jgi:hypothetical protein
MDSPAIASGLQEDEESQPDLKITEVFYDGSSEWIEIFNI